jgi:hypothetical protein
LSSDAAPLGACAVDGLVASAALPPVLPGVVEPVVVAAVPVPVVVVAVLPLGWLPVVDVAAFASDDGDDAVSAAMATLEPRLNPHTIRLEISERLNAILIVFLLWSPGAAKRERGRPVVTRSNARNLPARNVLTSRKRAERRG